MKKKIIIAGIVTLLIGLGIWLFILLSPDKTYVSVQQKLDNGGILIDVRTEDEFNKKHVIGAISLPLQDIQNGAVPNATRNSDVFVYCNTGNRSAQAKLLLENAGYTNVTDLGGLNDVIKIGAKTTKE